MAVWVWGPRRGTTRSKAEIQSRFLLCCVRHGHIICWREIPTAATIWFTIWLPVWYIQYKEKNLQKMYLRTVRIWKKSLMHNGNKDIDAEDLCCELVAIPQRLPKSMPPQEVHFILQQKILDNVPNVSVALRILSHFQYQWQVVNVVSQSSNL